MIFTKELWAELAASTERMYCPQHILYSIRRAVAMAALLLLLFGCSLPRHGKGPSCYEGVMSCELNAVDYKFTTKRHDYRFKGYCHIYPHEGGGPVPGEEISFTVKASYDRVNREFVERGEFSGTIQEKFALMGVSTNNPFISGYLADPWLFPHLKVGITAMKGNPEALVQKLCIYDYGPYYSIPFSRIVSRMLLKPSGDLKTMIAKAADPDPAPDPPPPPPCPPGWITGPPELVTPKPGLVYGKNVKKVPVYLKTRCGTENIKYKDNKGLWSWYIVFSEYEEDGIWKNHKGFNLNMAHNPSGGSHGFDSLPLDKPGHWRIQAKQLITKKKSNEVTISEPTEWTDFWLGEPLFDLSNMDFTKIAQVEYEQNEFKQVDQVWTSGNFETIRFRPPPQQDVDPKAKAGVADGVAKTKPRTTAVGLPLASDDSSKSPFAGPPSPVPGQTGPQINAKRSAVPLSRTSSANAASKGAGPPPQTQVARVDPGTTKIKKSKLELKDASRVNTLKLTAGETPELIFQVLNSGDLVSSPTTYTLTCRKLSNSTSKCPAFKKRGSLSPIGPSKRHNIKIRLSPVANGEYEFKLRLANGEVRTLILDVEAQQRTGKPGASRSAPKEQPERRSQ